MATIHTPSLHERVQPLLPLFAAAAERADRERRLPADVVAAARGAGLFRLLLPQALGGHETSLSDYVEVLQAVSGACGSVAWCMAVAGGCIHALAVQFPPERATPWLSRIGTGAIVSGTLPPMATATPVVGGYRVSGRWPFASLTEHADIRMVGVVAPGPLPSPTARDPRIGTPPEGAPPDRHLRFCIVPADTPGVTLHDTWYALTMQGSGSCDIELTDVFIPEEHTTAVDWSRHRSDLQGVLRLPFGVVQAFALAAISVGIARVALATAIERGQRPRGALPPTATVPSFQLAVAEAAVDVTAGRALLTTASAAADRRTQEEQPIAAVERTPWWIAAHGAAEAAVRAVDRLFAHSGARALYDDVPLQRHFRDVRVAQHHLHLHPGETAQEIGRSLLGLPVERHNW